MTDRTTLASLGRLVMNDVVAGQPAAHAEAAAQFLEARPEAVLDLLDMLVAEARKKRPREALIAAYALMIGQALEIARFAIEGGQADAAELVDVLRQRLLAVGEAGRLEPALLLLILREFGAAKLDPGSDLRGLMGRLTETMASSVPGPNEIEGLDTHLEALAREVGGDSFELHAHVREMADALPEDHRAALCDGLLQAKAETAREAALGWLLDASPAVRNSAASGLERAAERGDLSSVMLRRLIALRDWLREADRTSLDRAIQTCRSKGVEIGAWPQPKLRDVLASGIDGAGAQSVFILVREGRQNAVACLLLKHGIGVRDAWARHGLKRSELEEFLAQAQGIDLFPTSLEYVRVATAHALGVNLTSGVMPPFAMLDFMETAGLQDVPPDALAADAVLDLLEAHADPALSRPDGVAAVLARSRNLPGELDFLASWFDAETEVEQRLDRRRRAPKDATKDELLRQRTATWVERLAWTALTLRHGEHQPWEPFFVSARELKAGRPMAEIPLMTHVAALTVEAHAANQLGRRGPPTKRRRSTRQRQSFGSD